MKLMRFFTQKLANVLGTIGDVLNANPAPAGKIHPILNPQFLAKKMKRSKKGNQTPSKSQTHPKGHPNTDSKIFNHPRKDVPRG